MNITTVVGEIVRDYLTRYPDWPKKRIARLLCKEQPRVFHTEEYARGRIRYYCGQSGSLHRKDAARKDLFRPAGKVTDGYEPFPEPVSDDTTEWTVRQFTFKKALVISDVHVPFHDPKAVEIALSHGEQNKVDAVLINGDFCDFYRLSDFDKDPRSRPFESELKLCRQGLRSIRQRFPKALIVFKEGNHEERLWRYLIRRAPELAAIQNADGKQINGLSELLELDKLKIKCVQNKEPMLLGDHLYMLHGHEFRAPMTNPVNPARGLYLRTKANAICGDLHQTSQHSEAGIEKVVSTWSLGCLCHLHPRYMPLNKWNLGFALVHLKSDAWSVENHKIINGSVV